MANTRLTITGLNNIILPTVEAPEYLSLKKFPSLLLKCNT